MLALRMVVGSGSIQATGFGRRCAYNPEDFAVINMTEAGKGWRSGGPATDQIRYCHSAVQRAATELLSQTLDLVDEEGAKIFNQVIEG